MLYTNSKKRERSTSLQATVEVAIELGQPAHNVVVQLKDQEDMWTGRQERRRAEEAAVVDCTQPIRLDTLLGVCFMPDQAMNPSSQSGLREIKSNLQILHAALKQGWPTGPITLKGSDENRTWTGFWVYHA